MINSDINLANNLNNNEARFKKLLANLEINLPFNKDNVIQIDYFELPISIYYNDGLLVFYTSFTLEYKPSAMFSEILLSTCDITEQPSIQISNTDNDEITLWTREWLDKITDETFFIWLERFCEVARDWQYLLEEFNQKQELRELIRFSRKKI